MSSSSLRVSAANLRIPSDNFSVAIASSLSCQRNVTSSIVTFSMSTFWAMYYSINKYQKMAFFFHTSFNWELACYSVSGGLQLLQKFWSAMNIKCQSLEKDTHFIAQSRQLKMSEKGLACSIHSTVIQKLIRRQTSERVSKFIQPALRMLQNIKPPTLTRPYGASLHCPSRLMSIIATASSFFAYQWL